ncbi:hypothetical protein Tco_1076340, partial [Tanacetum coccineum]
MQRPESSNAGRERNLDGGQRGLKGRGVVKMCEGLEVKIQFVRFMGEDVNWNAYRTVNMKRFDVAYDVLWEKINLPEDQCISFFLAGLSNEIELAVRMFKPRTLAE